LFDGTGTPPSAIEGRKAILGIYLSLPAEVAAFFRGRGRNGDRKKKRKQGSRRRRAGK
jgi:hypothetical protein